MSVIIDIGKRNKRNTMWFRFREECIYSGETDPDKFTDETFVAKRDKELEKIGAKWITVEFNEHTDGMFKIEFDNEADANWFRLRWG